MQDLKSKPLATFLTVMVIAISLTLPSVCYMVYKNVNRAASQYYPSPQITVYLDKALDDNAAAQVVGQIQAEQGVEKVNYLSRDEALGEFRNWSGFGGALDMLEENPLPAVAVVIPKLDFGARIRSTPCATALPASTGLMKCAWTTAGLPVLPP